VRKAFGLSGTGWAHEVADYLVDVTDRHPDAVTALDGLGRFLAIVKNTITTCRKFDSPRGQHPYEESRGGRLLASSEREGAVLAAEPRGPDLVRCGRRNEDTGGKALRCSSLTPSRSEPAKPRWAPLDQILRCGAEDPEVVQTSARSPIEWCILPGSKQRTERGATAPPAWASRRAVGLALSATELRPYGAPL
jgi:hypothetical protein